MRIGIDFGTTHTVVALVDRGNYPVVSFEGGDFVPSLVAAHDASGTLRWGWDAAAVRHEPGWTVLPSVKRLLSDAGPSTEVAVGPRRLPIGALLEGFFSALHRELVGRSNAGIAADDAITAAVSVPANASTAQRFLTLEAFKGGGFDVEALLNEPSAAGFEYAHRNRRDGRREHLVVYDLGGGTFDASLLRMTGKTNEVVATHGVQRLGGDDFDEAILALVLEKAGARDVGEETRALVLEECVRSKESLTPNSRRFLVDLSALEKEPLVLPVDDVWEACVPLVARTLEAVAALVEEGADVTWADVASLYVVGGAGLFPLVPRLLKERFGDRRVRRSPHPFAATAMGLAVWPGPRGRLRARGQAVAALRRLPRGRRGRRRRLRHDLREGDAAARARRAAGRRRAPVPRGARRRPLPVPRVLAPHGRPARRRRDAVGRSLLPVRPGLARHRSFGRHGPAEGRRPGGRRGLRARERRRDHGHGDRREGRVCADVPSDALRRNRGARTDSRSQRAFFSSTTITSMGLSPALTSW